MSEESDTFKLVNAMELAKIARVGMELTYFDVIELLGELESLKEYIAELDGCIEELKKRIVELNWADRPALVGELKSRIAELEAAQRWRVIANGELPEEDGEYWVWFDDEFTGIKISGYCDYCDYSKQNGWDDTERVTHWMPLPEPPIVYGKECEG